jgi:alkylation response protein AidB-like acyl-CoA dehydrogenase
MDFGLSEQQEIMKKFAKDFLEEKFSRKVIKDLDKDISYSGDIWSEMASLGWTGLPFPEQYGGAGMTFLDLAILQEEMGRTCAISPYFSAMVLGAYPVYLFGTDEQKSEYLSQICSGSKVFTLALNEESPDCEADSLKTAAISENGSWVINGTKLFVPDGHVADYIICVAKTGNNSDPRENLTLFIVESGADGVERNLMKTRTERLCEVAFKNVRVTEKDILGGLNKGFNALQKILNIATAASCCQALGAAQKAMDMTVDYAKERKQYGKPVASFQAIQHYFADLLVDLYGMRVSAYQAAWMIDADLPCDREVAIAKSWMNQACERMISQTHQIHGAIGVTLDYDLHYYTRRLKSFILSSYDSNYYLNIIAEKINL